MASVISLKPSLFTVEKSPVRGLPSLSKPSSFKVMASGKKIKTDKPYGINGGMDLRDGLDATGRKGKGKGVYQFVDKYGANVDGYSPIFDTNDWSASGDVYVGGTTGLAIWAITLAGILAGVHSLYTTQVLWLSRSSAAVFIYIYVCSCVCVYICLVIENVPIDRCCLVVCNTAAEMTFRHVE